MAYLIGIDIGTSNTKAIAFSTDGEVLTHANRANEAQISHEGYHELDPERLFVSVIDVIVEVLSNTPPGELKVLCFSSAMHGLIAVDDKGKALTPMITWADLRSNEQAMRLRHTPDAENLYHRTGTPLHPMSPLCKIIWLREKAPEIFAAAHRFISIKEYVFFHLFGKFVVDFSIASATGLFDIYDLKWNQPALGIAGITELQLSEPVPADSVLTGLTAAYQSRLGLHSNTPFVIGASDGCLAHIGSGALGNLDISLTIGTSGAVRLMNTKPVVDQKQRIFNYVLADDLYISGGPVNNGGNVLQWFAQSFLKSDFRDADEIETFITEAVSASAGAGGLVFLPYIHGERAPVWDAEARGVFYGINATHRSPDFMRACMEGICFSLREILETLEHIAGKVGTIYASGGFIKSAAWVHLLADVLGKKLTVIQAEDSSATGAVMIGMKALKLIENYQGAARFFNQKELFEPNDANHKLCSENYQVYTALYEKLKDLKK